jgi:hypothetical protein
MRGKYLGKFLDQLKKVRLIGESKQTELDELIKHRNIISCVKAQRLSWFGHINRMPETGIVKKIYKWKPFTGRPVERPKCRWEDDVRNDPKNMKIIKWTGQVQIALNRRVLLRGPRLY